MAAAVKTFRKLAVLPLTLPAAGLKLLHYLDPDQGQSGRALRDSNLRSRSGGLFSLTACAHGQSIHLCFEKAAEAAHERGGRAHDQMRQVALEASRLDDRASFDCREHCAL